MRVSHVVMYGFSVLLFAATVPMYRYILARADVAESRALTLSPPALLHASPLASVMFSCLRGYLYSQTAAGYDAVMRDGRMMPCAALPGQRPVLASDQRCVAGVLVQVTHVRGLPTYTSLPDPDLLCAR